jgi:AraC-like DNA-binding protein
MRDTEHSDVSMMMVRALAGAIERRGGSRARFLQQAGLDARAVDDGSARMSLCAYLRVLDAALEVSGDPALGLHMGEEANPVMFDVVGYLAQQAATLRESIQAIERYSRLAAEGHDPRLVEAGATAAVQFPSLMGNLPAVRLTAEFALTGLASTLRLFVGPLARPTRLSFAYDEPAYSAEYARVFGAALHFSQAVTAIEFPRAWLDSTHSYANPNLHALLETRAERMLSRLQRHTPLSERVSRILAAHEPSRLPTMTEVARTLHMSARSLRRKLFAEDATYAALVERTQMNAAKRLLRDPRASIQETAYALGFAAPAAFHRAFKRWTGLTPKQYRAES